MKTEFKKSPFLLFSAFCLVFIGSLSGQAHASSPQAPTTCFGQPATHPGIFSGSCTLLIPSKSATPQTFEFKLSSLKQDGTSDDGYNGLAVFPFAVPAPGSSTEIYGYSLQFYNLAGICTRAPDQQLRMMLVYNPPFCQPPTLDGNPQQCDGPEDPAPLGAAARTTPHEGALLHIERQGPNLQVNCDGKFSEI